MTNTRLIHRASIRAQQGTEWFGCDTKPNLCLDIWLGGDSRLKVRLTQTDINGQDKVIATKTFRDCETQHSDSERWLNDKVGYPNPFAGILIAQGWNDNV